MAILQHQTHERLITKPLELTTSRQTFYTCPAKLSPRLSHVLLSNKTGATTPATASFTLEYYQASTTTYFSLATTEDILVDSRVLLDSNNMPLLSMKEGDLITCKASANSSIDCIVVVIEQEARKVV